MSLSRSTGKQAGPSSASGFENWDEDDDFGAIPSAHQFALPPTPSSPTSSSSSRSRLSSGHDPIVGSPLRQSTTTPSPVSLAKVNKGKSKSRKEMDMDDIDADFERAFADDGEGDAFGATNGGTVKMQLRPRGSLASNASSTSSRISKTVIPTSFAGTITKFTPTSSSSSSQQHRKAKQAAVSADWEGDFDMDMAPTAVVHRGLTKHKETSRDARPDNLDDLDDLYFGDEDQLTLKASGMDTLKAALPPPTIRSRPIAITIPPEESMDDDFDIPADAPPLTQANLRHLQYTHEEEDSIRARFRKLQQSQAGSGTTDFDTPHSRAKSRRTGDDLDSPKRDSETSATSYTSIGTPRDGNTLELEEEDPEDGLVFSGNSFRNPKELRRKLQIKLKPSMAHSNPNHHSAHRRYGTDETNTTGDGSMEDGLLFDDPQNELSKRNLRATARDREKTGLLSRKTGLRLAPQKGGRMDKEMDLQRQKLKQREEGWNKGTPARAKDLAESPYSVSTSTFRSHSTSAVPGVKDVLGPRRGDSQAGPSSNRPRSSLNNITLMAPPPLPPSSSHTGVTNLAPPLTPTGSRIRKQASTSHLPTGPPSLNLRRHPSMQSLQEEPFRSTDSPTGQAGTPARGTYSNSTSRLLRPTESSRNKVLPKVRASVRDVFPEQEVHDSSSLSSVSTDASVRSPKDIKMNSLSKGSARSMRGGSERGKLPSRWADGSELDGIADLAVDAPRGSGFSAHLGHGKPPAARRGQDGKTRVTSDERIQGIRPARQPIPGKRPRKAPGLIQYKGSQHYPKTVQGMTLNLVTHRWEGNEEALVPFDRPQSVGPALIKPLSTSYSSGSKGVLSPALNAASTVKIVGHMKFDPEKMCWVSILDPADEEPDPFDGMFDEDEDDRGGTIRAKNLISIGQAMGARSMNSQAWSGRIASESTMSTASTFLDGSVSSRGHVEEHLPPGLEEECREAESRHRAEMRGWVIRAVSMVDGDRRRKEELEVGRLWKIREWAIQAERKGEEAKEPKRREKERSR